MSQGESYNDSELQLRTPNRRDLPLRPFSMSYDVCKASHLIGQCGDDSCCLCYALKPQCNGALGSEFAFQNWRKSTQTCAP